MHEIKLKNNDSLLLNKNEVISCHFFIKNIEILTDYTQDKKISYKKNIFGFKKEIIEYGEMKHTNIKIRRLYLVDISFKNGKEKRFIIDEFSYLKDQENQKEIVDKIKELDEKFNKIKE
jgi:hypothetical protein